MTKVYSSAVVIIPPIELWTSIQEIRASYDRQIKRWMPHITVLYPFIIETEFNLIIDKFFKVCKNITPFEITLKEFGFFHHGKQNYTLLIKPSPAKLIIQLQQLLLDVVPECNDVNLHKKGYIPHLSLGQIKGKNQIITLIENLNKKWTKLHFFLDKIHFITRRPNKSSKFEIKKSIVLGNLI